MDRNQDKQAPSDAGGRSGFWYHLFRAEMLMQMVWAVVIGAVAITAIIVFGPR